MQRLAAEVGADARGVALLLLVFVPGSRSGLLRLITFRRGDRVRVVNVNWVNAAARFAVLALLLLVGVPDLPVEIGEVGSFRRADRRVVARRVLKGGDAEFVVDR